MEEKQTLHERLSDVRHKVVDHTKEKYTRAKKKWKQIDYPIYQLESVVESLNTGDIMLFHGVELHSVGIEFATQSFWSHAALLIRNPSAQVRAAYNVDQYFERAEKEGCPMTRDAKHEVYLYESDYDTVDKRVGGGTQLVPIEYWLFDYERLYGKKMFAVIRRLVLPGRKGDDAVDFPNLEQLLMKMSDVAYQKNWKTMVRSVMYKNKRDDESSVFCSELVAAGLKHMGLMNTAMIESNVLPKDFHSKSYGKLHHPRHYKLNDFPLERHARLEKEWRLILQTHIYKDAVRNACLAEAPLPAKASEAPFEVDEETIALVAASAKE